MIATPVIKSTSPNEPIFSTELVLSEKINGPSKEICPIEQKNWRKQPTMKVLDMVQNKKKAIVENQYIAQRKFLFHKEGNLTFSQIRENLGMTYGGFTKDGKYFHNERIS